MVTRKVLAALAGAVLIVGATGTLTPAAAADTVSAKACADLGGTVTADSTCQAHTATPTYTLDMSVPLDYPDQQAVADFLTQDRDDFMHWIADFGGKGRHRPYTHNVTAKTYRSSGTQSLVLKIDDDTGASHDDHPGTTYHAFNYDLSKHTPITFDTLFKPDSNPLDVLNPIVRRELGKHPYTPVQDLDATTYRNFAITDDAVTFFFGEDEAVADNGGPHQVAVPRAELATLMARS